MIGTNGAASLEVLARPQSSNEPSFGEYAISPEGLGATEGLSAADAPADSEPIQVVPRFVKHMIAVQEHCGCDKAPNLTIGQWLHAQPAAVQRRERLRALRKLGLVIF